MNNVVFYPHNNITETLYKHKDMMKFNIMGILERKGADNIFESKDNEIDTVVIVEEEKEINENKKDIIDLFNKAKEKNVNVVVLNNINEKVKKEIMKKELPVFQTNISKQEIYNYITEISNKKTKNKIKRILIFGTSDSNNSLGQKLELYKILEKKQETKMIFTDKNLGILFEHVGIQNSSINFGETTQYINCMIKEAAIENYKNVIIENNFGIDRIETFEEICGNISIINGVNPDVIIISAGDDYEKLRKSLQFIEIYNHRRAPTYYITGSNNKIEEENKVGAKQIFDISEVINDL